MFGINITGSLLFVCIFVPEYFYLRKICPESFCRDETPYFLLGKYLQNVSCGVVY